VLGKGSQIKIRLSLLLIVFSFSAASLAAAEYTYSGAELSALAGTLSREFDLHPYELPYPDAPDAGISLLELLPLMEYVYEFAIVTSGGETRFSGDELGDEWGEIFFVDGSAGPVLFHRGVRYGHLREIRFAGQPLDADTLEIWLSWEGTDRLKAEIERFANRHGFSVRASSVPGPEAKLAAIVRARGAVPDLVMAQTSGVSMLVEARALQALDYLDFPNLVSQGRPAFTLDGSLWAMPFYFDTQVLYYNRELIPHIPPDDWTLGVMESQARRLQDTGVHPMVWNAYSSNWLIPFQMSFGKTALLDPDGAITVNDEPTREALRYLLRLQEEGLLVPMERDGMDALFIGGQVGMMLSGSYAIPYFESLGLEFGVLPFPLNQETGRQVSSLLDFKGFVMTRQTRHPVVARRVLEYLYGPGVQRRFCVELHKLSVREELRARVAEESEYGGMLEATVASGTVIPPDRAYGVYKNTMWKLLRFAFTGQMSVEETLRAGQELMDAER
jgi:ABC-type glycerol-3-phosphate transport system substrate-binding protein